jgi:hypothetical protein
MLKEAWHVRPAREKPMRVTVQLSEALAELGGLPAPCDACNLRRWSARNTPGKLDLVRDLKGELVIPAAGLAYLLNASPRDLLAWRYRPEFPAERPYALAPFAGGYQPDELIGFLKTLPARDQARVCPVLPLGPVNALSRGSLHGRVSQMPFHPNVKEVTVAITVMAATAALSLLGLALVW